jgi:hypothetical protein
VVSFLLAFTPKSYTHSSSHLCYMPAHLAFLDLTVLIIFCEGYELWGSSLRSSFQSLPILYTGKCTLALMYTHKTYICKELKQTCLMQFSFKCEEVLYLRRQFSFKKKKKKKKKTKHHGLSPRANYTDWVTAACRRSDCQLLRIEGATWSAWWITTAVVSVF